MFDPATQVTPCAAALLEIIPEDRPYRLIEVGVLRGHTMATLLHRRPLLSIVGVDDWRQAVRGMLGREIKEQAHDLLRPFGDRACLLECASAKGAGIAGKADVVHIDADHGYHGCLADCRAYWPLAGEWMCGHDYGHGRFPDVQSAVWAFAEEIGATYEVFPQWKHWRIRK